MRHAEYIQTPEKKDGFFPRMSRRARLFSVVAVVALIGVAVLLYMRSGVYALERVAIEGNALITNTEIELLLPLGENLFSLDTEALSSKLTHHPYIAEAYLEKVYPDKLIVRVNERTPVCWLAEGPLQLLDDNGTVLPIRALEKHPETNENNAVKTAGFDLPVITGYAVERRGELERYDDEAIRAACELCAEMQRQALPLFDELIEIRPRDDHLEGLLTDSSRILFPLNVSPAELAALQAVYTRERRNGLIELDIRYERQIISRNSPS